MPFLLGKMVPIRSFTSCQGLQRIPNPPSDDTGASDFYLIDYLPSHEAPHFVVITSQQTSNPDCRHTHNRG
jgi:hypothetical protein